MATAVDISGLPAYKPMTGTPNAQPTNQSQTGNVDISGLPSYQGQSAQTAPPQGTQGGNAIDTSFNLGNNPDYQHFQQTGGGQGIVPAVEQLAGTGYDVGKGVIGGVLHAGVGLVQSGADLTKVAGQVTGLKSTEQFGQAVSDRAQEANQDIDNITELKSTLIPQWAADLGGAAALWAIPGADIEKAVSSAGEITDSLAENYPKLANAAKIAVRGITSGTLWGAANAATTPGTTQDKEAAAEFGGLAGVGSELISPISKEISAITKSAAVNLIKPLIIKPGSKTEVAIERYGGSGAAGVVKYVSDYLSNKVAGLTAGQQLASVGKMLTDNNNQVWDLIKDKDFAGQTYDPINAGLEKGLQTNMLKYASGQFGSPAKSNAFLTDIIKAGQKVWDKDFVPRLQKFGTNGVLTSDDLQGFKAAYGGSFNAALSKDKAPDAINEARTYLWKQLAGAQDDMTGGITNDLNKQSQNLLIAKQGLDRNVAKDTMLKWGNLTNVALAGLGMGVIAMGHPDIGGALEGISGAKEILTVPAVRTLAAKSLSKISDMFGSLANVTDVEKLTGAVTKYINDNPETAAPIKTIMQNAPDKTPSGLSKWLDGKIKAIENPTKNAINILNNLHDNTSLRADIPAMSDITKGKPVINLKSIPNGAINLGNSEASALKYANENTPQMVEDYIRNEDAIKGTQSPPLGKGEIPTTKLTSPSKSATMDSMKPLLEEARKYKSAEEFVKAQTQVTDGVKHLDPAKYSDYTAFVRDIEKLNSNGESAFYIGKKPASLSASDPVKELKVAEQLWGNKPKTAPVMDVNIKDIIQQERPLNFTHKAGRQIDTPVEIQMIDGKPNLVDGRHRLDQARANGETTIKAKVTGTSHLSQLTDIWNKANKPTDTALPPLNRSQSSNDPLAQEAKKYKSAEEFIKEKNKSLLNESINIKSKLPTDETRLNPQLPEMVDDTKIIKIRGQIDADFNFVKKYLENKGYEVFSDGSPSKYLTVINPITGDRIPGLIRIADHGNISQMSDGMFIGKKTNYKMNIAPDGVDNSISNEADMAEKLDDYYPTLTKSQLTDIFNKAHNK